MEAHGDYEKSLRYLLLCRSTSVFQFIEHHHLFSYMRQDDNLVALMLLEPLPEKETKKEREAREASEKEFDARVMLMPEQEAAAAREAAKKDAARARRKTEKDARRRVMESGAEFLFANFELETTCRALQNYASKDDGYLLHIFLDFVFRRDPFVGKEFHDTQLELYSRHNPGKMADFLRRSNHYNFEVAKEVCTRAKLWDSLVHVHLRMGASKEGINICVHKLGDIRKAAEEIARLDDESLWDVLVDACLASGEKRNEYVGQLLACIGYYSSPSRVIEKIPEGLSIPDLKQRLISIFADYRLQFELATVAERVLSADVGNMQRYLVSEQKRGMCCGTGVEKCATCNVSTVEMKRTRFFCNHSLCINCVVWPDGEVPESQPALCPICARDRRRVGSGHRRSHK